LTRGMQMLNTGPKSEQWFIGRKLVQHAVACVYNIIFSPITSQKSSSQAYFTIEKWKRSIFTL
jgi:hypothetical protein